MKKLHSYKMKGSASENPSEVNAYMNEGYVDHIWDNEGPTKSQGKENESRTEPKTLTKEEKEIKWSILKNVICLSFAFTLLFISFDSLGSLQSSLYNKMGRISLGVINGAMVTTCIFLPSLIIKILTPKWGICLAMIFYSPYFAALYYPRYYTFIPTAFILGLAGGPLWAAKCIYITEIGEKYAEIVGEDFKVIVLRFFGIFYCFIQSSYVWGNLISSAVLSVGVSNYTRSEDFLALCGANSCPDLKLDFEVVSLESIRLQANDTSQTSNESPVEPFKIYIMTTIYLLLVFSAVALIAFVVDPLSRYEIEMSHRKTKMKDLFLATLIQIKKPYQILLTPLTIWSGFEEAFLVADYTAAFVTCGIGIHMVGYVYLCFGVADAIFSYVFTPLIKYVKRVPIFTFGAIVNVALIIVMFTWKPHPDDYIVFFLIASLWGMCDAIWQTPINAFYGVIFSDEAEAAFLIYRFWKTFGFLLAYGISGFLCMRIKLYICFFSLVIGMAGYYATEILKSKRNKNIDNMDINN